MTAFIGRRDFISLVGGAAVAWPLAARAEPDRMRRVGVLMAFANAPIGRAYLTAFRQALQDAGWVESRNIQIEERWGGGDGERLREYWPAVGAPWRH
jgi:hypothetical protein